MSSSATVSHVSRSNKWLLPAAIRRLRFCSCLWSCAVCAATLCSADQFQCRDGGCISNSSKCNQKVDCEDASDEMSCGRLRKSQKKSVVRKIASSPIRGIMYFCSLCQAATDCSSYFHLGVKGVVFQKCEFTTLCYAPSWQCDGANDCGDFSDEKNCPGILTATEIWIFPP